MSDVVVLSHTQKIIVDPSSSSVAIISAGPIGPTGVTGPPGPDPNYATLLEAVAGVEEDVSLSPYTLSQIQPRRDVRTFISGGNPIGDQSAALQDAFESGIPLIVPGNVEIEVAFQLVLPNNLDIQIDGRITRTWNGGGSGNAGAMFIAGTNATTRASNIKISGNGSVGASSLISGTGQIFALRCDDLTVQNIKVDTYSQGQAFLLTGHRINFFNVGVINSPATTGTGAYRFQGGEDFIAVGCYGECGDDVFQFVPGESGGGIPIRRGAYINCKGYSTAARLMAVISGGVAPANIENVSFIGIHGRASNRGVLICVQDDSPATINNVTITDCSIDMTNDTTTSTSTEGAVRIAHNSTVSTAVVKNVNITNLHVINPARQAVRLVGIISNVRFDKCKFDPDRTNAAAFIQIEDCSNCEIVDCDILGVGTSYTIGVGPSSGQNPKNVKIVNNRINIKNAAYGVRMFRGSTHKVTYNTFISDVGNIPTANVYLSDSVSSDCVVSDNDMSQSFAPISVLVQNGRVGYIYNNSINSLNEVTTTYLVTPNDARKTIVANSPSPFDISLPNDAGKSIPIGESFDIFNKGAGLVTITPTSPSTISGQTSVISGNRIRVTKIAANTWVTPTVNSGGLTYVESEWAPAISSIANMCVWKIPSMGHKAQWTGSFWEPLTPTKSDLNACCFIGEMSLWYDAETDLVGGVLPNKGLGGSAYDYTLTGATILTDASSKKYILTDGIDDYLQSPDGDVWTFTTSDSLTMIFFGKIIAIPASGSAIWGNRGSSGGVANGAHLSYNSSGAFGLRVGDGSVGSSSGLITPELNKISSFVGWRDRSGSPSLGGMVDDFEGSETVDSTTGLINNTNASRVGRLSSTGASYTNLNVYSFGLLRRSITDNEKILINDIRLARYG